MEQETPVGFHRAKCRLMRASCIAGSTIFTLLTAVSPLVQAQDKDADGTQPTRRGAAATLQEQITITARKQEEQAQDVPVAVTAFDSDQLQAAGFNSLLDLSFSIPNASLDEVGTGRGIASFAIRGLSATSSIPSIDPAVATFIDGIYLATNAGTVLDQFDVEAVEVLRGPQGTLFGRNVTGGAVLIRTKRPSQEFQIESTLRIETGPDYTIGIAGQGGITETLSLRIAMYYNNDRGYFENLGVQIDPTINGGDSRAGANTTWFFRPSLLWEPTPSLSFWLKYEHLEQQGQQPPPQNQANFFGTTDDRVAFDFVAEGRYDVDAITFETNWDVGPGTLTNLFGYRIYRSNGGNDIDATTESRFHSGAFTGTDTFSNEIRYAGALFGDFLDFTVGVFAYYSELDYTEQRFLLGGAAFQEGGGIQDTRAIALFTENQLHFTDRLTGILGLRYSIEDKEVDFSEVSGGTDGDGNCEGIASFPLTFNPDCTITSTDEDTWYTFGFKVGAEYAVTNSAITYAQFTRGFRSGGFNLRDTVVDGTNQDSYDEEELDVFEIGLKADWLDGRLRTNGALFRGFIEGVQRDVNVPTPSGGGVTQTTANTGDAVIKGGEFEGQFLVLDTLLLTAQFGYVDFDYDQIFIDISGDDVVTEADFALEFPRAAEFTYGGSITYDYDIGMGYLTTRVSYDHRDPTFFTDNNLTPLLGADILSARMSYTFESGMNVAIFGRNMLNNIVAAGSTAIAAPFGLPDPNFPTQQLFGGTGTFSPLQEGRVWGLEINVTY